MTIKFNLYKIRKDKKLTLTDLSNICNISVSQLSEIENNNADPKLSTLILISNALNVTPNELYTYYI